MKVLLINGSPRPKGNTSIALAEVANQLERNGIVRNFEYALPDDEYAGSHFPILEYRIWP